MRGIDNNVECYFLAHSGFLVDDGKRCYVFDYYKDPNNIVWQLAKRGRELWFFVKPCSCRSF